MFSFLHHARVCLVLSCCLVFCGLRDFVSVVYLYDSGGLSQWSLLSVWNGWTILATASRRADSIFCVVCDLMFAV